MELGLILSWDMKDYSSGLKWVRRAAKQGSLGAQYFLAAELATGEHVKRNLREAAKWYRAAAKSGHPEAQYNLALMLWGGEGVRKSTRAAHHWLEAAAKGGELLALRALTEAYSEGQMGYRRDLDKARYWARRYQRARKR
jgi:TPR repeat protein